MFDSHETRGLCITNSNSYNEFEFQLFQDSSGEKIDGVVWTKNKILQKRLKSSKRMKVKAKRGAEECKSRNTNWKRMWQSMGDVFKNSRLVVAVVDTYGGNTQFLYVHRQLLAQKARKNVSISERLTTSIINNYVVTYCEWCAGSVRLRRFLSVSSGAQNWFQITRRTIVLRSIHLKNSTDQHNLW